MFFLTKQKNPHPQKKKKKGGGGGGRERRGVGCRPERLESRETEREEKESRDPAPPSPSRLLASILIAQDPAEMGWDGHGHGIRGAIMYVRTYVCIV